MEGKEFKEIEFYQAAKTEIKDISPTRQRRIGHLTNSVACRTPEAVKLDVDSNSRTRQTNDARNKANSIISTINLAQEATNEIGRLVKSVDGIAEQVEAGDVSQERREVLEAEANNLVEEIKRKAQRSSQEIEPIVNDQVRAEIEEKLGKTLDDLIPTDTDGVFDIGQIKLDMKEGIVDVRTAVAKAQQRIAHIQNIIKEAESQVQGLVNSYEVAAQNIEASQVSIRDLDDALNVAIETGGKIESSPKEALQSSGSLDKVAVNRLINEQVKF